MPLRSPILALLAGLLFASGGCKEKGPEFGQVTGTVTVKGKPMKGVALTFMPEPSPGHELRINAGGLTDAQGRYELAYAYEGTQGRGAPVGMHRVMALDTRFTGIPQGAPKPPRVFSTDYSSPTTTPLKIEVKPGEQTIDLELK